MSTHLDVQHSVVFSHFLFDFKIGPIDLGKIDAMGQAVSALEREKMSEIHKIDSSDF